MFFWFHRIPIGSCTTSRISSSPIRTRPIRVSLKNKQFIQFNSKSDCVIELGATVHTIKALQMRLSLSICPYVRPRVCSRNCGARWSLEWKESKLKRRGMCVTKASCLSLSLYFVLKLLLTTLHSSVCVGRAVFISCFGISTLLFDCLETGLYHRHTHTQLGRLSLYKARSKLNNRMRAADLRITQRSHMSFFFLL